MPHRSQTISRRRLLLASLLVAVGPKHAGSAPADDGEDDRPLRDTVRLPAARVTELWQPAPFEAWIETEATAKRLAGVLLRVAAEDGTADGLRAFCAICPHEICHVEMAPDPAGLPLDAAPPPTHPVLVCPCHFSVFDPVDNGRAISGPALRGLYLFDTQLVDGTVEIDHVEAGVEAIFD